MGFKYMHDDGIVMTTGKKPIYFSQVLDRVVQILNCFSAETPELRFVELARRLELNKTTLYRLLEAMRSYRLVEFDKVTGKYHPGMKLFELGTMAIERLEIGKCFGPALEELVARTGETAHLCVLDGSDVIYIAKAESPRAFRMPSSVGRKNPAYCTGVGKAILAQLSDEELEKYLARTPLLAFTRKTVTSPTELKKQLRVARMSGYSFDDQEISDGIRCIGASIRDHTGCVTAAISIAGPAMRITKQKVPELARFVMAAASSISAQLGCPSTAPGFIRQVERTVGTRGPARP